MILRRTFWFFILLLVLSLVAVEVIEPARAGIFFRLIYISILTIIISLFWAFFSVRYYTIRRTSRSQRHQLGQVFEERFEVQNLSKFSRPWVDLRDESNLPGTGGSRILSRIGRGETRNYSAYTLLLERGQFQLGPTVLYCGDPFGLFSLKRSFPADRSLLVLPYVYKIQQFPFPPGLLPGGKAKKHKTPEVTTHAAGVREYVNGDPLNRIHWATTARRDRLMVKEFDQDPQSDVWIFLDSQRGTHYSESGLISPSKVDQFWIWKHQGEFNLPLDTFEYSVCVAASIARYFSIKGQNIGFGCAGQNVIALPAERGERQFGKILETLALIQPVGKMPLSEVIESQSSHIQSGSTAIIISANSGENVIFAVDNLLHRKLRPVVVLIDQESFGSQKSISDSTTAIVFRKIPLTVIHQNDNLVDSLENGFSNSWL